MGEDLDLWMTAARETGDREAFAQVVGACHHILRATILRDTADPELADEIVQDALVRAWSKRHQYRPGTSPRSWLITIARSQLMEHHRRQAGPDSRGPWLRPWLGRRHGSRRSTP